MHAYIDYLPTTHEACLPGAMQALSLAIETLALEAIRTVSHPEAEPFLICHVSAPAADLRLHVEAVDDIIAQRMQQPQVELRRQGVCSLATRKHNNTMAAVNSQVSIFSNKQVQSASAGSAAYVKACCPLQVRGQGCCHMQMLGGDEVQLSYCDLMIHLFSVDLHPKQPWPK